MRSFYEIFRRKYRFFGIYLYARMSILSPRVQHKLFHSVCIVQPYNDQVCFIRRPKSIQNKVCTFSTHMPHAPLHSLWYHLYVLRLAHVSMYTQAAAMKVNGQQLARHKLSAVALINTSFRVNALCQLFNHIGRACAHGDIWPISDCLYAIDFHLIKREK